MATILVQKMSSEFKKITTQIILFPGKFTFGDRIEDAERNNYSNFVEIMTFIFYKDSKLAFV